MGLLIGLLLLVFLLWIGFKVTGAVLLACLWLFIKLPLALICLILGAVFCCTIILIPVGLGLFKAAVRLILPGTLCW